MIKNEWWLSRHAPGQSADAPPEREVLCQEHRYEWSGRLNDNLVALIGDATTDPCRVCGA